MPIHSRFKRNAWSVLIRRVQEPRKFMQVVTGPRQVGKTTLVLQLFEAFAGRSHYASADEPALRDTSWIGQQWETARALGVGGKNALLALDELQKIPGWSETVKRLWDEDSRKHRPLKVILLGSSPLLLQRGLTESLAGRFETLHLSHWSYREMKEAFGWSWEQYVFFGGYPGSAHLIGEEQRWKRYIVDSLIETSISRDILLLTRIDKPALLKQLFYLSCQYSGQIVSYQKLVGQLQDAGNTTTLAHYLELLGAAGLVTGLRKFAGKKIRQRASSPKLLVMNTALLSAQSELTFREAQDDRAYWGRLVESSVGAHLVNATIGSPLQVFYWREGANEVDFVLHGKRMLTSIEVKSGRGKDRTTGLEKFRRQFTPQRSILIGDDGIPPETFVTGELGVWLES